MRFCLTFSNAHSEDKQSTEKAEKSKVKNRTREAVGLWWIEQGIKSLLTGALLLCS